MSRKPVDPGHPKRITAATKFSFHEDVILTKLEGTSGLSRSELVRLATRPLLAAAATQNKTQALKEFEEALNTAVFHEQVKQLEQDHEADILTQLAKDPGPSCTGPNCPLHNRKRF